MLIPPLRRSAFISFALASFAIHANAQTNDRLDKFVNEYLHDNNIPGCAVMVRNKGQVFTKGYGIANEEWNTPVTTKTLFQSGSVGKIFTAMAVMMLDQDHKLSLDDPVSKYLKIPDSWSGIKVKHLLSHTSGLGDYPNWVTYQESYNEESMLGMITSQRLAYGPGRRFRYSNLGYVTLGMLIHKVTGEFYGDFLTDRVFGPLGMADTRVISDQDIIPNRASGYVIGDNAELKNQEWVSPTFNSTADGTLYFTVEDLAKWAEELEAKKLLRPESYKKMWTQFELTDRSSGPYGFGWYVDDSNPTHPARWHDGLWQGFSAYIIHFPNDRLTVAVLCNLRDAKSGYMGDHIAELCERDLASQKSRSSTH
jgi:D-alanyl-D-alanine carboxypeptidase